MWIRYMKFGEIVSEWQPIDDIWPDYDEDDWHKDVVG